MTESMFTDLRRQTLAAIVDTFVAAVPHEGEDPHGFYSTSGSSLGAHEAVEGYLTEKVPSDQLEGLLGLVDALALTGLKNQPLHIREAAIGVIAGIAPEAAAGIGAVRQLSINFAYGLTDEAGYNPLLAGMGHPGVPRIPNRAGKTLKVLETQANQVIEADVVVIGSGSGGGVAAATLATAGKKVVVLEAGSYYAESDFGLTELALYEQLCLNGGLFPTTDGMVNVVAGGAVGGGSTLNWSNCVPLPDRLRARWAEEFGLTDVSEDVWTEHLDAVMTRMKVNDKVAVQNAAHTKMRVGAEALGWSYARTKLNIDPDKFDPHLQGFSGLGDATGAKQGAMRTWLQDASDAGADLVPNARAVRVLTADDRATGVEVEIVDASTGAVRHTLTVLAPTVVVSAGTMETPALLLRSGIGGPAVGTRLKLHPAGLVTGMYGEVDIDPTYGPCQAGLVNEFATASKGGSAFLIEGAQQFPGLYASATPWTSAADHKALTARYRSRADFVFFIEDVGSGQISIDEAGNSLAAYPFQHEGDQRTFKNAMIAAFRIHVAAGADTVFASGQPFAPWRTGDDVDAYIARLEALPIGPGGLAAFSAHQMGSAALGADPATSVADPRGELHDTKGVWIADASAMPTCSSVNPMITTMTLARRTATNILAS